MFKLKCDDFLTFDESTGQYSMPADQAVRDEAEKNRWKSVGLTILKDWRLYLMLVPMLLVYLLWKYLPMTELLAVFKNTDSAQLVDEQTWHGLENFKTLLFGANARTFWMSFRNTFILAFYGLLFGFPLPIILALFFNEVRSNIARSIMQVCVYLPKFLSTVVVTSLAISMLRSGNDSSMGIISKFLCLFAGKDSIMHETATTVGLVYDSRYFRAIYIVTDLWEHAGYDSIVFFAAVIAVSPTSYEAAQIDGAGKMQQMRYVVIPSILSTVVIMLIMKIGSLLSISYEKLYLFCPDSGQNNSEAATVVSTFANEKGDAIGIAAEMLNNLTGMILVIGANTISRKASDVSLY